MIVIGLGYKAGVGKDTVASYLEDQHGFVRVAFADSLKTEVLTTYRGLILEVMKTYSKKKTLLEDWSIYCREVRDTPLEEWLVWVNKPPFIRALLQDHGHGQRTNVSEYHWISTVSTKLQRLQEARRDRVVISDLRYLNEAKFIQDMPRGYCIDIRRPAKVLKGWLAKHASEVELDRFNGWDYIIDNDGTIRQLYRAVDQWVEKNIAENR